MLQKEAAKRRDTARIFTEAGETQRSAADVAEAQISEAYRPSARLSAADLHSKQVHKGHVSSHAVIARRFGAPSVRLPQPRRNQQHPHHRAAPLQERFTLYVSAETTAERMAPTTGALEPIDEHSCTLRAGSNSPDELAIYIASQGFDFQVPIGGAPVDGGFRQTRVVVTELKPAFHARTIHAPLLLLRQSAAGWLSEHDVTWPHADPPRP